MTDRYRFMLAEKANFAVSRMAPRLGVSRSGYYSWVANGCPEDDWTEERRVVREIWEESDRVYGIRTIHSLLPGDMAHVSMYRVAKIMRDLGIHGCNPFKPKRTTVPRPDAAPKPDLVRRDFTSPVPTYKLVGDITYLRTGQGWLYLATVIDLYSRMVVGWAISERMTADIVVEALERAKGRGYVAENAIFHSDRGAQYTSRKLIEWAARNDVRLSCSRTGNCHDNAVAESFFSRLKGEMYHRRSFRTKLAARAAVIDYIERRYNRLRPHSTLGYRTPASVMEGFFERTRPVVATMERAA